MKHTVYTKYVQVLNYTMHKNIPESTANSKAKQQVLAEINLSKC